MNYHHLDNILPPPPLTGRSVRRAAGVPSSLPTVAMLDLAIATVSGGGGAGQSTTEEPAERQHSTVDQGEDLLDCSHTEPVSESSFNYSNEGVQEFYHDDNNNTTTSLLNNNNNSSSTHQSSKIHNSSNNNSSRSNSRSNHTSSNGGSGVGKQVDEAVITSPVVALSPGVRGKIRSTKGMNAFLSPNRSPGKGLIRLNLNNNSAGSEDSPLPPKSPNNKSSSHKSPSRSNKKKDKKKLKGLLQMNTAANAIVTTSPIGDVGRGSILPPLTTATAEQDSSAHRRQAIQQQESSAHRRTVSANDSSAHRRQVVQQQQQESSAHRRTNDSSAHRRQAVQQQESSAHRRTTVNDSSAHKRKVNDKPTEIHVHSSNNMQLHLDDTREQHGTTSNQRTDSGNLSGSNSSGGAVIAPTNERSFSTHESRDASSIELMNPQDHPNLSSKQQHHIMHTRHQHHPDDSDHLDDSGLLGGIKSPLPAAYSKKHGNLKPPKSGNLRRASSENRDERKIRRKSSKEGGSKRKSKKKVRKFVTFFDQARMKNTLHLNDYSMLEINSTWYDEDEMFDIRQEVRATLNVMAATSKKDSKGGGGKPSKSTFHLAQLLCCRGLENLSEEGVERRATVRENARYAVLDEQQRQRQCGMYNEELLANIYRANCQRSSIVATMLGALDATESMNVFEEDLINADDNDEGYNAGHHKAYHDDILMYQGMSLMSPRRKRSFTNKRNVNQSRNHHHHDHNVNDENKLDPMEMGRIINGLMAHMHI